MQIKIHKELIHHFP